MTGLAGGGAASLRGRVNPTPCPLRLYILIAAAEPHTRRPQRESLEWIVFPLIWSQQSNLTVNLCSLESLCWQQHLERLSAEAGQSQVEKTLSLLE